MTAAETWTNSHDAPAGAAARPVWPSIRRGLAGRCPHCGKGRMFGRFLKTVDACEACGEDLSHHRADDLPPYLTIIVVGHLMVPLVLAVEKNFHPDIWLQMAVWLPLTLALTLVMLQPIKGGVVGLQWANRMHGFGAGDDDGRDPTFVAEPTGPRGA